MYYCIENEQILESTFKEWQTKKDVFCVLTPEEFNKLSSTDRHGLVPLKYESIRFCKIERYAGHLLGTFHIPSRKHDKGYTAFQFFIYERKIVFIDSGDYVKKHIQNLISAKYRKSYTLERFFYDFLVLLIENEPVYLANLEKRISKLEEHIIKHNIKNFNFQILEIKKEISIIYRYYSQLADMGDTLVENEDDFFGKDDIVTFPVFTDRAQRLQNEIQSLRDYAMQVQEVYQTEIGIKQNDVMKVLTIVTTLFLPLSLIAAWYGMNFTCMPEVTWKYGYLFVIILSVAVVLLCIWIFKKKKLL